MRRWRSMLTDEKHCRWCSKSYMAKIPFYRDGFDSNKCRQAHYRAYKKYVTETSSGQAAAMTSRGAGRITQK